MSQKLFNVVADSGGIPTATELDDIIFTVLEEYGEGFYDWLLYNVKEKHSPGIKLFGRQEYITFPEVIQEYRKYCSQQNIKPCQTNCPSISPKPLPDTHW